MFFSQLLVNPYWSVLWDLTTLLKCFVYYWNPLFSFYEIIPFYFIYFQCNVSSEKGKRYVWKINAQLGRERMYCFWLFRSNMMVQIIFLYLNILGVLRKMSYQLLNMTGTDMQWVISKIKVWLCKRVCVYFQAWSL